MARKIVDVRTYSTLEAMCDLSEKMEGTVEDLAELADDYKGDVPQEYLERVRAIVALTRKLQHDLEHDPITWVW